MTHGVLAPQRSTFTSRKTVNGSRGDVTPWVRPADWLALTTPSPSDQRMVGLAAVFQSNSNFVTVRSSAAFKVDWGDGAGWNLYAANTTAEKNLQWADYDAGTLTTWGYRQAVVQVEPQSGNLTGLELQWRHSNAATSANTSSVWLDLRIACTGTPVLTGSGPGWNHAMVETVEITSPITSGYYLFRNCYSLQSVPALNTSAGTNFTSMFQNCYSLQGSDVYGGKYAISYATANLSAAALDNIYTNLGTASGAQTITVTSNWGTSGDDPSIATAKGWTVVGS